MPGAQHRLVFRLDDTAIPIFRVHGLLAMVEEAQLESGDAVLGKPVEAPLGYVEDEDRERAHRVVLWP